MGVSICSSGCSEIHQAGLKFTDDIYPLLPPPSAGIKRVRPTEKSLFDT